MRLMIRALRLSAFLLMLGALALTGARGQAQAREMRIGLQRAQPVVRLQGTAPLQVTAPGMDALTVPAEGTLVVQSVPAGVTLADAAGTVLATAAGAVQVRPAPAGEAAPAEALIRLLGPTRHYDGKPDRPYRGRFELLPRADGITVVNVVALESYLLGVVSSEMSPSYPVEALKAQAVAARTYAVKHVGRMSDYGYDLDDTPGCQVYGGYLSEDPRTTQAVLETAGMLLTYRGTLIDAVYSSTCGGFTESAEEAWGRAVPYLTSVSDFGDDVHVRYPQDEAGWAAFFKSGPPVHCLQPQHAKLEAFRWVKLITRAELEAGLPAAYRVGTIKAITPLARGSSGRITRLRLTGSERAVILEKELPIRKAFGGLRTSAFVVDTYTDDAGTPVVFAFWGAGWGHGLGMCQVGAVGMAGQGYTYERILKFYYRGAEVERR